jgi:hypothetical protein
MDLGSDMIIDDLPSGSVWVFLVNMFISFFFQFVGFLLTFLLHTSHAAKYGSRAGLGLTLIQYGRTILPAFRTSDSPSTGFYSRAGGVNDPETDEAPDWPTLSPNAVSEPSSSADVPQPDAGDITLGGVSSRDWLSFLLMTVGAWSRIPVNNLFLTCLCRVVPAPLILHRVLAHQALGELHTRIVATDHCRGHRARRGGTA